MPGMRKRQEVKSQDTQDKEENEMKKVLRKGYTR